MAGLLPANGHQSQEPLHEFKGPSPFEAPVGGGGRINAKPS